MTEEMNLKTKRVKLLNHTEWQHMTQPIGRFTLILPTENAAENHHLLMFSATIFRLNNIRSATCDFQQCGILTSVDTDKPVQHPVKLRNSK